MACPHCGGQNTPRDYAPPRPFAYALGGGAILLMGLFFREAMAEWSAWRQQLFQVLGLAMLFVGAVEMRTHQNRYCAQCGTKFRMPRRGGYPGSDRESFLEAALTRPGQRRPEKEHARAKEGTKDLPEGAGGFERIRRAGRDAGGRDGDAPPPDTPIPPLLKVLRFKNPAMRAEAAQTLRQLTGEDFGDDADAWDAWYRKRSAAEEGRDGDGEGASGR